MGSHSFTYDGIGITTACLAKQLGVKANAIYYASSKYGTDNGNELEDYMAIANAKTGKSKMVMDDVVVTVESVAKSLGLKTATLANRIAKYGQDSCKCYFPAGIPIPRKMFVKKRALRTEILNRDDDTLSSGLAPRKSVSDIKVGSWEKINLL